MNWEEILALTHPLEWSSAAMYEVSLSCILLHGVVCQHAQLPCVNPLSTTTAKKTLATHLRWYVRCVRKDQ
eukprot:3118049-Amphidinium_carterae.1